MDGYRARVHGRMQNGWSIEVLGNAVIAAHDTLLLGPSARILKYIYTYFLCAISLGRNGGKIAKQPLIAKRIVALDLSLSFTSKPTLGRLLGTLPKSRSPTSS